jgi:hypothetical protein
MMVQVHGSDDNLASFPPLVTLVPCQQKDTRFSVSAIRARPRTALNDPTRNLQNPSRLCKSFLQASEAD